MFFLFILVLYYIGVQYNIKRLKHPIQFLKIDFCHSKQLFINLYKIYGYAFESIFTAYGHYFYKPIHTKKFSIAFLV